MNWKEIYGSRLVSVEEAVKHVKSGDHIAFGHAAAEPFALTEALVKRTELRDVVITHMGCVSSGEHVRPELEGIFRCNALFGGPTKSTRRAINEGRADLTPIFFHEVPKYYREHMPPDVAFIQVSPPDENGYVSLGISVDYTYAIVECARRLVIAQVNKKMPHTCGDSLVHVSKIDYFAEDDRQLIQCPMARISEIETSIGKHVAELIKDGDCLQLGIGALPDAVLNQLYDKKNLGIHTEMFSDGVVDLVRAGIINGSAKNINRNKITASFLLGTDKTYNFVHNNPIVEMRGVDYVNKPFVISQIDNLISINSCIQVDLLGQVASDTIGYKQYSGVGGQVDFVRGAAGSRGGKSIMAMPSVTKDGKTSRIVPILDEGAVVTTSRYDVQYVVTEYGIADLRFKTRKQRVEQLIAVAHPEFREELMDNAKKRNLI